MQFITLAALPVLLLEVTGSVALIFLQAVTKTPDLLSDRNVITFCPRKYKGFHLWTLYCYADCCLLTKRKHSGNLHAFDLLCIFALLDRNHLWEINFLFHVIILQHLFHFYPNAFFCLSSISFLFIGSASLVSTWIFDDIIYLF